MQAVEAKIAEAMQEKEKRQRGRDDVAPPKPAAVADEEGEESVKDSKTRMKRPAATGKQTTGTILSHERSRFQFRVRIKGLPSKAFRYPSKTNKALNEALWAAKGYIKEQCELLEISA